MRFERSSIESSISHNKYMTKLNRNSPIVAKLKRWCGFAFRLIVGLALMLFVPQTAMHFGARAMGNLNASCVSAVLALVAFFLFVRATEGAWPQVLRLGVGAKELAAGVALGVALSATSVAVLWLLGAYEVVSVLPGSEWGYVLLAALPIPIFSSVVEELAIRGVVTRQIARTFSPAAALVVSAILFGAIHLMNDNATLGVGIGLVVQAGLLLGVAYLWTQRLWLPIGLHFAWNFMQAGVVGGALSGSKVSAILTPAAHGPEWLSGGAFGIEGSTVTTLVCFAVAAAMFYLATKGGLRWGEPQRLDG